MVVLKFKTNKQMSSLIHTTRVWNTFVRCAKSQQGAKQNTFVRCAKSQQGAKQNNQHCPIMNISYKQCPGRNAYYWVDNNIWD